MPFKETCPMEERIIMLKSMTAVFLPIANLPGVLALAAPHFMIG